MLLTLPAPPGLLIVEPHRMLPRFWATVWAFSLVNQSASLNTRKLKLRHLAIFYAFCDEKYGLDSLDDAISLRDAGAVQCMLEAFYLHVTATADRNTGDVQRWDVVRQFLQVHARHLATGSDEWSRLSSLLYSMGKLPRPRRGSFRFRRALPAATLRDLMEVANPASPRAAFRVESVRWRNWVIVNLLLLCGLRRGEAMLLQCDSLKSEVDHDTGEVVNWLDVTTCYDFDPQSTAPGIKTESSHRQVPVSQGLADLYLLYLSDHRVEGADHPYLLTSQAGRPLSAESITKLFDKLSCALSDDARTAYFDRSGGKEHVSPHDMRHTCATARWVHFMAADKNRDLSLQRMRAFFGWSVTSNMPEHYARAAIQDDLMKGWADVFDSRMNVLRSAT